jgi:PTH1 family peptidyl-tRNA hydrolase
LRSLLAERRWNPANCILVHDDLDLPLGKVKVRMRGSAGGHRGVASILDAFQTDAIRRVKVGVGRPAAGVAASGYVLESFSPDDLPVICKARAEAVEKVLSLAAAGLSSSNSVGPPLRAAC